MSMSISKRFILCLSFLIWLFPLFSQQTFAHTLATDNAIGAILHIDPDDDPVVGQQTNFFFEFKDRTNKFTPQACDCTFSILEHGKEIYAQPLFQNTAPSLSNAGASFTLPERDVYTLRVTGKPYQQEFQPFILTWEIRASRVASSPADTVKSTWLMSHVPLLLGGGIIAVVLIGVVIQERKRYKRDGKTGKK